MLQKIKQILQNSFYQLLVIYTILVLLISLNLFWKYSLQFQIFAFILAIIGISITSSQTKDTSDTHKNNLQHINKKSKIIHYSLFGLEI